MDYLGRIGFTHRGQFVLWTLSAAGQWSSNHSGDEDLLRQANSLFAVRSMSPARGQAGVQETIGCASWLSGRPDVSNVKPEWPRLKQDPRTIY